MYIQNAAQGPVQELSYLTVMANTAGKLILKVLDIEGRMAKTVEAQINEGKQQLELNMADLRSGMYIINAFCGDMFINSFRFVKQ